MQHTNVRLLLCIALSILPCSLPAQTTSHLQRVDLPAYEIPAGAAPRQFAYTNRRSTVYCGVLNGANSSKKHGITQRNQKLFENYWIRVGNTLLDPRHARVRATPAGFVRYYASFNTEEHVAFSDSLALLTVSIKTDFRGTVAIYPGWSSSWQTAVEAVGNGMYALRDSSVQIAASVLGVTGNWEIARMRDVLRFSNPVPMHMPACYVGETDGVLHLTVEIAPAEAHLSPRSPRDLFRITKQKQLAISDYLASLGFACSDSAATSACNWIASSMRALVMRQDEAGIFDGLPSLEGAGGRDTFVALPGALLVTGQFETAKEILRSFLRTMDRDSSSTTYGRIPDRVETDNLRYTTADGTPRLVMRAMEYFRASGDSSFLREIYPDVRRTVQGALRHTDAHGLLTHGDAETWMDADGPEGPRSPRGNRAVEIQVLWHGQLLAAADIAEVLGRAEQAARWRERARRLAGAFRDHFIREEEHTSPAPSPDPSPPPYSRFITDHLNADGSSDTMLRPNALFALTGGTILAGVDSVQLQRFAADLLSPLTYPWGVASLWQNDPHFHPWYSAPGIYPEDAAHHNGTVWNWLTGPAISMLARYGSEDSAWVLTRALQRYAMERGTVGGIPDVGDALPLPDAAQPRQSVAPFHAASAAEYLRTMYEDYLGFLPGRDDAGPFLTLYPHVPSPLTFMEGSTRISSTRLHVCYDVVRDEEDIVTLLCTVSMLEGSAPLRILPPPDAGRGTLFDACLLRPGETRHFRIVQPGRFTGEAFRERFHFAVPRSLDGIPAIPRASWPHKARSKTEIK